MSRTLLVLAALALVAALGLWFVPRGPSSVDMTAAPAADAPPPAPPAPGEPAPIPARPDLPEDPGATVELTTPEDTLEAWITAQEQGDFSWAASFVVKAQQEAFQQTVEEMSSDDLIAAGLQFRDEDYRLDFSDEKLAVFWSETARLYLVMQHEDDGRWRVDPAKSDEMNGQVPAPPASGS